MTLRRRLFPEQKNARFVQTEWCEDWVDLEAGFGYAAQELTECRESFGATIDQAGIAIFFLQRHRIELILKAWLKDLGSPDRTSHSLGKLLNAVQEIVEQKYPEDWEWFRGKHVEFVNLVASEDEGSFVFRYPEGKDGVPFERPDYIDLDVMHEQVESLVTSVVAFMDRENEYRDESGGHL